MTISGLLEALIALRPALLRYLALRGASADEAEDVLQDVGLKLSAGGLAPVEQARAYLYRMVHNQFLLQRRTQARRASREETWTDIHGGDPPDIDQTPSPESAISARQQLVLLQQVIEALPERTRLILRRYRVEGTPQGQIAAELGISRSAVEKHLLRAYAVIAKEKARTDEEGSAPRSLSRGGREDHDH